MRKMLILMLVLGVVSVASAGMTLQISVNDNNNPIDSQITLLPSQTAELDIWSPNGWQNVGDNGYFGLVCAPAYGTITGGVAHPAPGGAAPDNTEMLYDDLSEFFGNPGIYGQIFMATLIGGPGVFVDEVTFHCVAPGDAVVQVITTDFETYFIVHDTLTIHQIPEPATLFLLSLGGLFFRKRGK